MRGEREAVTVARGGRLEIRHEQLGAALFHNGLADPGGEHIFGRLGAEADQAVLLPDGFEPLP